MTEPPGTVPAWMQECRSFIDAVGDQMMAVDRDYRIRMINKAFVEQTGRTEREVLGRRCHEITHGSDEPCSASGEPCPLSAVLEGGEQVTVRHEHVVAGDGHQYLDIVGAPLRNPEGATIGVLESMRDVTRQAELEAELRARHAELEKAQHKREQFTSSVCHELHNILNNMGLQAELLRSGKNVERAQQRAESLIDEVRRLGRLIEDLQDASAIESQHFSLTRARVDLADLVERTASAHRAVSSEHRIETDLSGDPIHGTWDEQRLRQVVDNLVGNAIKYSPRGGEVRLRVRANEGRAHVSVSDEGIGIPPESLPQLFEPYARLHADLPGLGLGLFVSRSIVEAHGGEISASSEPGRGTTIELWLPLDPPGGASGPSAMTG